MPRNTHIIPCTAPQNILPPGCYRSAHTIARIYYRIRVYCLATYTASTDSISGELRACCAQICYATCPRYVARRIYCCTRSARPARAAASTYYCSRRASQHMFTCVRNRSSKHTVPARTPCNASRPRCYLAPHDICCAGHSPTVNMPRHDMQRFTRLGTARQHPLCLLSLSSPRAPAPPEPQPRELPRPSRPPTPCRPVRRAQLCPREPTPPRPPGGARSGRCLECSSRVEER